MEGDEIWKAHGVAWFVPKFDHPFARMSAYITTLRSVVDELYVNVFNQMRLPIYSLV